MKLLSCFDRSFSKWLDINGSEVWQKIYLLLSGFFYIIFLPKICLMSLAFRLLLEKGRNLRLDLFLNYVLHTLLETESLKHPLWSFKVVIFFFLQSQEVLMKIMGQYLAIYIYKLYKLGVLLFILILKLFIMSWKGTIWNM